MSEAPREPLAIQQPCRGYGLDEAIHPVQIAAFRWMTPKADLVFSGCAVIAGLASLILPQPRKDIASLWHVLRLAKAGH